MFARFAADWSDLRTALRVVATVAWRELLVERRYRTKFLLDATGHLLGLLPVLLTAWAVTGGGASATVTNLLGIDWLTFALLGYTAFAAFGLASPVLSFTGMAFALHNEQITGTLERSLLAPAPRLAVVLGSGVYYTALFLVHVVTLLLVSGPVLGIAVIWSPATITLAALVLLLIVVMSTGFGVLTSALLLTVKDDSLVMTLTFRPLLLLSGAFYLIPYIPEPFRTLAWFNPIAYAIDAFRGSLSGATVLLPLPAELGILAACSIGALAGGLLLFDRLMARWLRTGALGAY
jgi:ABC-type polysaccharide/polyol phosphate export permease